MEILRRALLGLRERDDVEVRVARGTAGTFALKLCSTLLYFVIGVLLARMLGTAGYGAYAYAMACVGLLGVPALLGLDNLLIRNVSVLHSEFAWGRLNGLLAWANRQVLRASLAVMVLAGLATWALEGRLEPEMLAALQVVLVLLPLVTLTRLRQATLQGLDRVVSGQVPELILAPLLVLAGILAFRFVPGLELTAPMAVGLNTLGAGVAFLVGAALLRRALPLAVVQARPEFRGSEWIRSALPLVLLASMHILNSRVDTLMLGAIRGAEAVGIYGVASRGAEFVTFLLMAANPALAPVAARLHAGGDSEALQRMITRAVRVILAASLPVAIFLIGFGDRFLLIYGNDFLPGRVALGVLGFAQLVNVAAGPVGLLLIMTGHERDAARAVALSAALNAALNAALIPRWGVEGAALATAASLIVWNLLLAGWVVRRLGIHPTALGRIRQMEPRS